MAARLAYRLSSDPDDMWRENALCRPGEGYDPELWFPVNEGRHAGEDAKAVCRQCPVIRECYESSIRSRHGLQEGIWAGLSAEERRRGLKPRPHFGVPETPKCAHGHERTAENTLIDSSGTRRCRACNRDRQAEYQARQKALVAS